MKLYALITTLLVFQTSGAVLIDGAFAHQGHHKHDSKPVGKRGIVDLSSRVGGSFTLVDHAGRQVTDSSYSGKYLLVFFGYTTCPDVCPTSLVMISAALDRLGPLAERVQPLFISVDNEHDSPAVLAKYVSNFHPSIVGLTGSVEQIQLVTRKYRVAYAKVARKSGGYDYTLDHSSLTYLMDPNGKYLAHFAIETPEQLANKVKDFVGTRKPAAP